MPNLPLNRQQLILILLIFLIGTDSFQNPLKSIASTFNSHTFSRDLHMLVDMLDRMESIGQLTSPGANALLPDGMDMNQLADMASSFMNLLSSSEK